MFVKRLLLIVGLCAVALFVVACDAQSWDEWPRVYKVGSRYDVDGKEGVVFYVADDGRHGKIVSLKDAGSGTWDEAVAWSRGLDDGWYLPSKDEMLALYEKLDRVNDTLDDFGEPLSGWYWTSTEENSSNAWLINMSSGYTSSNYKSVDFYVRAISTF